MVISCKAWRPNSSDNAYIITKIQWPKYQQYHKQKNRNMRITIPIELLRVRSIPLVYVTIIFFLHVLLCFWVSMKTGLLYLFMISLKIINFIGYLLYIYLLLSLSRFYLKLFLNQFLVLYRLGTKTTKLHIFISFIQHPFKLLIIIIWWGFHFQTN